MILVLGAMAQEARAAREAAFAALQIFFDSDAINVPFRALLE